MSGFGTMCFVLFIQSTIIGLRSEFEQVMAIAFGKELALWHSTLPER